MKQAVIQLGGKQIHVSEGATFKIERQADLSGMEVLFYTDGKTHKVGTPTLSDVTVKATVEGEERARKIRVARYKSKSRYRKVKGHRQPMSVVKVESILLKGEKPVEKEPTKTAPKTSLKTKKEKEVTETKTKKEVKAKTAVKSKPKANKTAAKSKK